MTQRLTDFSNTLNQFLQNMSGHYGSKPPHVYQIGYYPVWDELTEGCAEAAGIDPLERVWLTSMYSRLEGVLSATAAKFDFVSYVPVDYRGHEFCSEQPWVQGFGDTSVYHPTAAGQQAYADTVTARFRGQ